MFRLGLLCAEPASYHVFGRGVDEDGECGEEDRDLPGIQDFSKRGLRVEEGADKADIISIKSAWHPHIRSGLSKCVLNIAQAVGVRCSARYS